MDDIPPKSSFLDIERAQDDNLETNMGVICSNSVS